MTEHALHRDPPDRRETDEVVSMLAHEIRGALNEIVLVQGLLLAGTRAGVTPEDQESRLRQIGRASSRIAALLDMLTDVGRRELVGADQGRQPMAVAPLVAAVIGDLTAEAAAAHVELTSDIAPELPLIRTDETAVRAALRTLLAAAVKHAAGSAVRLSARCTDDGVRIEISGISAPLRGSPREPPPGVRPLPPRRPAGVALRLYVAERLVHSVGGRADIHDEPAGDATVGLTLPVV
jgi:signal transduction histidine kinase